MDEEQAASIIRDTLEWAARQAQNPAFNISRRGNEIRFKDRITGDLFTMTVKRV